MAQSGTSREQVWKARWGEKMIESLKKTQTHNRVTYIAEYVVMLFVTLMTGLSTLRLLGILP
jgi:hypothetical protein